MADITRQGRAQWKGGLKDGSGTTSTGSGALREVAYSFPTRFETGQGTNPEELIAAAHASCFSMMLSKILGDQSKTAQEINTTATLTLRMEGGPKIRKIHLATAARVAGMDENAFQNAVKEAKDKCPVSVLLQPGLEEISIEAKLLT